MGLVDRINAETRAIGGVPWRPWDSPYWRFDFGGPVHPSRAGPTGQENALSLAPFYACVRFIAEGVAKLPVNQYRDDGKQTVKLPARSCWRSRRRTCGRLTGKSSA